MRVEREEWRAEHEHGAPLPVGTEVMVLRVDGTRVVVRQLPVPGSGHEIEGDVP